MGSARVHPTQRRISCEVCRKHKSRCQRLNRNDAKCARCVLYGVECTAGQQKKVGRPRRAAASDKYASKEPDLVTNPNPDDAPSAPIEKYNQLKLQSTSQDVSLWQGQTQFDWSMISPAATPGKAVDDESVAVPAWSPKEMDYLDPDLFIWDTANDLDDGLFLSPEKSNFAVTPATADSLDTPSKSLSLADTNYYYPPINILMMPRQDDGISMSDAMAELSKINLDLYLRVAAAEANRTTLNFNSVSYREGPLWIDNFTLTEFLLKTSQSFMLILSRLLYSRRSHTLPSVSQQTGLSSSAPLLPLLSHFGQDMHQKSTFATSFPSTSAAPQSLLAPLALIITSIFTQLTSLYDVILEYLTTRIKRIAIDPIAPIPGLTFGGLSLAQPCAQGILFSEFVIQLFERMEQALGISPAHGSGDGGLLCARQTEVLWSELDGRRSIIPGRDLMKPAQVRTLFGKVAYVLRHLCF